MNNERKSDFLIDFVKKSGIKFVDVGCSDSLARHWHFLQPYLRYVGFDPNDEECKRLSVLPNSYLSVKYLPYAILCKVGKAKLYKTKSPYCCSCLYPRLEWVKRFKIGDYWQVIDEELVPCTTLDNLYISESIRADILKLDTQGTEVEILNSSKLLLEEVLCVDIETGFTRQYQDESIFTQIDEILRSKGFILYDLNLMRFGRNNLFYNRGKTQPLGCGCIYIRDFFSDSSLDVPRPIINRAKTIKMLFICKGLGFFDYAYEVACYCAERGFLNGDELNGIKKILRKNLIRQKIKQKMLNLLARSL
jgi:FkbM family methyltransferase